MNVELWDKFTLCQKVINAQEGKYSLNKILHFSGFNQKMIQHLKDSFRYFLAGIEC